MKVSTLVIVLALSTTGQFLYGQGTARIVVLDGLAGGVEQIVEEAGEQRRLTGESGDRVGSMHIGSAAASGTSMAEVRRT